LALTVALSGLTTRPATSKPPPMVPSPAYFRPVVVDGRAFPVARSNHFSLLEFGDNWHAVRLRLIDGKWEPVGVHEGIDITAEAGTPVLSMTAGVVENAGWLFYSGLRVGVRGTDGRYYLYAHLSSLAPGIGVGTMVSPGDPLGRMGNTGYGGPGHRDEFPPHLHFGIEDDGRWVNPFPVLVSLYDSAVERDARNRSALERLAARGDREGWDRLAGRVFTPFADA
jgi:murein DD-endopeptidase MepM/ murein hydrolase activator NlpD